MIVRDIKIDNSDIFEKKVEQLTDYLKIPNNRWESLSKLEKILGDMAYPCSSAFQRYEGDQYIFHIAKPTDSKGPKIGDECKSFIMDFRKHQCYSFDTKIEAVVFGQIFVEFDKDNLVNRQDVGPQNLDIKVKMGGSLFHSDKVDNTYSVDRVFGNLSERNLNLRRNERDFEEEYEEDLGRDEI